MDSREQTFMKKFNTAARHLDVKPDQIISLKLRENVSSYQQYHDLIDILSHEAGIKYSKIDGDLQGRGYLLVHEKTKVIIVEHESGLEILYIAGSIASLVGLVPLLIQGWRALRSHFGGKDIIDLHGIEIRRIDGNGHLIEDQQFNRHFGTMIISGVFIPQLLETAGVIETEIKTLNEKVNSLYSRIDALEKILSNNREYNKKTFKSATKRSNKNKQRPTKR